MKRSVHTGQFRSMPSRLAGELSERVEDGANSLQLHNAFLDDIMFGVRPNDLILIGAFPGIGKTDLINNIAATNAMMGKSVHVFALEAEPRELERRTKYAMLSNLAHAAGVPDVEGLNYAEWRMGRCETICEQFNGQVDRLIGKKLASLYTFYRDQVFGFEDLRRIALDISESTDLIIIDHLHYIDLSSEDNETQAMSELVKSVRDLSQNIGKPVILVAHLRKRDLNGRRLLPSLEDFHGTSNIAKICTHAITLDRCNVVEPKAWYEAPTFFRVLKDRLIGEQPYAAVMTYDRRTKSYSPHYTLGVLSKGNTEWTPLSAYDRPSWATHHKPTETTTA